MFFMHYKNSARVMQQCFLCIFTLCILGSCNSKQVDSSDVTTITSESSSDISDTSKLAFQPRVPDFSIANKAPSLFFEADMGTEIDTLGLSSRPYYKQYMLYMNWLTNNYDKSIGEYQNKIITLPLNIYDPNGKYRFNKSNGAIYLNKLDSTNLYSAGFVQRLGKYLSFFESVYDTMIQQDGPPLGFNFDFIIPGQEGSEQYKEIINFDKKVFILNDTIAIHAFKRDMFAHNVYLVKENGKYRVHRVNWGGPYITQ